MSLTGNENILFLSGSKCLGGKMPLWLLWDYKLLVTCNDMVVYIIPLCMKKQMPNTSVLQRDLFYIIVKLVMT